MAYFAWKGITSQGNEAKGVVLASSVEAAQLYLMYDGIALFKIKKKQAQSRRARKRFLHELLAKLAVLTSHGLSLHKALDIINKQTRHVYNKANITTLHHDVNCGQSLADSIAQNFDETSAYLQALIKSGEESGLMGPMLQNIAHHLEQKAALRKKIIAATTGPLITLLFTTVIVVMLLVAVVPQFERLFIVLEKPMPPATAWLVAVAHNIQSLRFIVALGVSFSFIVFFYQYAKRIRWLRKAHAHIILGVPVLGKIVLYLQLSNFLHMIGMLCDATLPLHKAASMAAKSTNNLIVTSWLDDITTQLRHGQPFIEALSVLPAPIRYELSDLLSPTISIGIKQETLALATQSLESDALKLLNRLIAIIGPLLLVCVGAVIFGILVFLYLPLFNLANTI